MWERADLKEKAKSVLKTNYWKAFLVSLVMGFLSSGQGGNITARLMPDSNYMDAYQRGYLRMFLIGIIISLVVAILVGFALEVGGTKFFLEAAEERESQLEYLGFSFKKDYYIEIIKAMLYRDILIFLWTLLFIIPGIIKGYAYRMVPYILADNPNIGYKRAIELSNEMTDGQKFDMWILDLSFIGWWLLGLLALGVGILFVIPYQNATYAELYRALRSEALHNGSCTYEELGLKNTEILWE